MGNSVNLKTPYFGGKTDDNIDITYSLLPQKEFDKFVDMNLGSGNVTRNIACEMGNIERLAIEKDITIFTMHTCIRNNPIQLIEAIRKLKNDAETFNRMKKIVDDCIKNGEVIDEIEVAAATIYTICFSYNNMRSQYRHAKYKHLDFDNVLRQKEESCMRAFETVFYEKMPMVIMDLSEAWQGVQILNDDFMKHLYFLEEEGTVCYLDPPYELHKRGIPKGQKRKNAGYLVDMEQQAHERMVEEIIRLHKENKLKASVMICTNYSVDSDENLIIEPDDLYATLLQYGFRMVVVEIKGSSEVIRKQTIDTTEPKKQKKRKAEVIYINYRDICGNWDDFQFLDEKDVFGR